ncbi:MAG: hypothetical protein ACQETL_07420 [Bacteroidota bacterium]
MRFTKEDFFKRAKEVHGNKYDYSKVDFRNVQKRVIIICSQHGEFELRPRAHYADKRGCPDCDTSGKSGFSNKNSWAIDRPKFFYIVEMYSKDEKFLKIGLTVDDISSRVIKGLINYDYKIIYSRRVKGGLREEEILKDTFRSSRYTPTKKFSGHTECFDYKVKDQIIKDAKEILENNMDS